MIEAELSRLNNLVNIHRIVGIAFMDYMNDADMEIPEGWSLHPYTMFYVPPEYSVTKHR